MDTPSDVAKSYRTAELRLRSLLLGDGTETVGLARRDEDRTRVIANLRRMRDAFNALATHAEDAAEVEQAGARIAQFMEDLLRAATERAHPPASDDQLSAAEAAQQLGMSTSTLYRAVRRGHVAAVRSVGEPMRIPASEVRRLAGSASA
jgi:excisionase family DNA binding protein